MNAYSFRYLWQGSNQQKYCMIFKMKRNVLFSLFFVAYTKGKSKMQIFYLKYK